MKESAPRAIAWIRTNAIPSGALKLESDGVMLPKSISRSNIS